MKICGRASPQSSLLFSLRRQPKRSEITRGFKQSSRQTMAQRPNLDLIILVNICISGQLCDSFTSRGKCIYVCVASHDPREDNVEPDQHSRSDPNKRLSFSHDGILISQESKLGFSLSVLSVTSCPPFISCPRPPHRPTSHHGALQWGTKKRESGWIDLRSAPTLRRGNCVLMSFCRKHRMAPKHRGELLSFKLSF